MINRLLLANVHLEVRDLLRTLIFRRRADVWFFRENENYAEIGAIVFCSKLN